MRRLAALLPPLRRAAGRLPRDAGGGVLVPVAFILPILAGLAMLVVDGSRFMTLHTTLQGAADALALAAAAELDRRPDALGRADRAIRTLVRNDQRFGEGAAAITDGDVEVTYLSALPARDSLPIDYSKTTLDPLQAGFVEVRVRPRTLAPLFLRAAGFGGAVPQARASAVGGFEQAVCNFSPFFICNPMEGTGTNIYDAVRDGTLRGRLFKLKDKGGGSQYFPGNYGFLQPPGGKGANEVREMIAVDRPAACFRQAGVELRTGNISSVAEAFNTRFDMYDGNFKHVRGDAAYRPAASVRKGFLGSGCSQEIAYDPTSRPSNNEDALGMPRDNCFLGGSGCPAVGAAMAGRIGDGKWDCERYWRTNFPSRSLPVKDGRSCANDSAAWSRYEIYRYEIDNGLTNDRGVGAPSSGGKKATAGTPGEIGAPVCYTGDRTAIVSDPLDRRLITAAILDCASLGPVSGSSGGPFPVTAFARFFLTEPMDKGEGEVWAELVDIIEPGTPGAREILRDIVQLHR